MLFFKSRNERLLNGYQKITEKVKRYRDEYAQLSDAEILQKTQLLKEKIEKNTFKPYVAEGLALACVASVRTLDLSPYDVQIIGALALLDGKIAEMRTGEGKTLTAALAAVTRSFEGKGVHVVTVNDYLARRDSATMSPLFGFLGQNVGVVYSGMDDSAKLKAYASDITYATNNEIGFDYLRDNMAVDRVDQKMRGLHYAIVDEVDSILIDEARTPLIISGPSVDGPDVYKAADTVARILVPTEDEANTDADYWVDAKNKQVLLTEQGMERAEVLFKEVGLLGEEDSLYAAQNITYVYHLNAALRAHTLYLKDVAYLVRDGEVQIVDEFTGRVMPSRRWGDGLHQAIEMKEGLEIRPEQQTVASVTLQNLFRAYNFLAGMTGTADTEAGEFMEIYNLEVVVIPPHRPLRRVDKNDMVFLNMNGKFRRVVADVQEIAATGQPILLGTASIEMSERLSDLLTAANIPHNVLNAKQHEREAKIIADAGTLGAVTIATNMAGRGTDIVLGGSQEHLAQLRANIQSAEDEDTRVRLQSELDEAKRVWQENHDKVVALGGLHIMGTERHESRRIDNQLRGRSGRQGDNGSSQFYISFEDPLMKMFATDFAKRALAGLGMKEDDVINMPMITRQIERAQRSVEAHNFNIRKNLLDFDNVSNEQRKVYYEWREEILSVSHLLDHAVDMFNETLTENIGMIYAKHTAEGEDLVDEVKAFTSSLNIPTELVSSLKEYDWSSASNFTDALVQKLDEWLENSHKKLGAEWLLQTRAILLMAHDLHWREHLAALDVLRKGIHLRGYAQKQPKQEFKRESFELFKSMISAARHDSARAVCGMTLSMLNGPTEAPIAKQEKKAANWQYTEGNNWFPVNRPSVWNVEWTLAVAAGTVNVVLPSLHHSSVFEPKLPLAQFIYNKNS